MSFRTIKKEALHEFIGGLLGEYKVVGPVEKLNGQFVLEEIKEPDEIKLDYVHTLLPPKKYLFPQEETLLTFDLSKNKLKETIEEESLVLFGLHPCDLHGLKRLDMVFKDGTPDPYYLKRRDAAILIGINCMPDDQCFCASVQTMKPPKGGFDLFLTDIGEGYVVEIGSAKGDELLNKHTKSEQVTAADIVKLNKWFEEKQKKQKLSVKIEVGHLPLLFGGQYDDPIWEELGQRCLSCGACNFVCPTCYCFDVKDDVEIASLNKGERKRIWDGCQLEEFAAVAGGENFREDRSSRNRHRFYRKFLYPVIKHKKTFCVGCGRCVRNCLVHISIVDTVNYFVEKSLQGGLK